MKNIDSLAHMAEIALCMAVKKNHDFHQSTSKIKTMVTNLGINDEKCVQLLEELIKLFNCEK